MKTISFKKGLSQIQESLQYYPVELILAFITSCILSYMKCADMSQNANARFLVFGLAIAIAYLFNQLITNHSYRWIYYLMLPVGIALQLFDMSTLFQSATIYISWLIVLFGIAIAKSTTSPYAFAKNIIDLALDFILASIASGLLFLICIAIYSSIAYIFSIESWFAHSNDFMSYTTYIICPLILIIIFFALHKQHDPEDSIRNQRLIHIFFNFILTPALILYSIILYIYVINILITGILPQGEVSYLIFTFLSVTFMSIPLQALLEKQPFKWFYRFFPYIAIVPLLLFWYGYIYRIGSFGYTEMRIYLMLTGIWFTYNLLILAIKPNTSFRFLILFGMFIFGIFTYIPAFSANKLSIISQRAQLENLVTKIAEQDANGTLIEINQGNIDSDDAQRLYNIYCYLNKHDNEQWLKDHYGYTRAELNQKFHFQKFNMWEENLKVNEQQFSTTYQQVVFTEPGTLYTEKQIKVKSRKQEVTITINDSTTVTIQPLSLIEDYQKNDSSDCSNVKLKPEQLTIEQNNMTIYITQLYIINGEINDCQIFAIYLKK